MLNFITKNNRRKIALEYFSRFSIIFLIFIFFIVIILTTLFIPSTISSRYKDENLTNQLTSIENIYKNKGEDPTKLIRQINALSAALSNKDTITMSDIVEKVISLKTNDIKISSMGIVNGDALSKQITVSGISNNRDALTLFAKNIKSDGLFSDINFPVSDLIRDNSTFSITMTLNPK